MEGLIALYIFFELLIHYKIGVVDLFKDNVQLAYEALEDNNDYKKCSEILCSSGDLTEEIMNLVSGKDNHIENCVVDIVKLLQTLYNESDYNVISDSTYDELYDYINQKGIDVVGTQVSSDNKKVYSHKYTELRGTLDKVHFITDKDKGNDSKRSLESWVRGIGNIMGSSLSFDQRKAVAFAKWDGVSNVLEGNENGDGLINRALKRGYTEKNEAESVRILEGLPLPIDPSYLTGNPIGIKTEIVMSKPDYERYCKNVEKMKSPRSAVTSILNSDDATITDCSYLTIIPLQMMEVGGTINPHVPGSINEDYSMDIVDISNEDEVRNVVEMIERNAKTDGYPVDGVVIRLVDDSIQLKAGRKESINKYEVAYKFPTTRAMTKVIDVDFSLGDSGRVTPVLKVEPVIMEGNEIKSISLGSYALLTSKNLHVGDLVELSYNIIPFVERVVHTNTGDKIKLQSTCPSCGSELLMGVIPTCVNPSCEGLMQGKINHYIKKMKIENISYATVRDLFDAGLLTKVEDIYDLHTHSKSISEFKGYGNVSVDRMLSGINKRREVTSSEFLGSMGIKNAGRRVFKKIMSVYTLDLLLNNIEDKSLRVELGKIEGLGEITVDNIISGLKTQMTTINRLRKELVISNDIIEDDNYVMSVCFTKVRDKEFEKYLDDNNIKVEDTCKKSVSYLIVPDSSTSSAKITKAKKDGVKILTIDEAYELTKYR